MHERAVEAAGQVIAALLSKGEFGPKNHAWEALRDEEVTQACGIILSQMGARLSITPDRCYLVPNDLSSPLLQGTSRMTEVFHDKGRIEPGRANLIAALTILILRKLLDARSEDALTQAGRGGIVPVEAMVHECEDALAELSHLEGLSDYMTSALDEWDRSARPATGNANVFSHEGYVRYVLRALVRKGLITTDNGADEDNIAFFMPTKRLVAQAREVLDSERYQELVGTLVEGKE